MMRDRSHMGGALAGPVTAYVYDWNLLPMGQALWLKELETYIDFPPLQDPASYNLEQVVQQVRQMIGVAAGYTWSGTSELKQIWVDKAYRGRGYARALLNAFVSEACSRGVRRIWVASYDFQAPGMYEKAGFKRMAEFEGWPEGHINVILCKTLSSGGKLNR